MRAIKLPFSAKLASKILSGEKRLTTRKDNVAGLAPGEVGVTDVQGRTVYVRGRGWRLFDESQRAGLDRTPGMLEEFGGIQGYSAAEGGLNLPPFPSGGGLPADDFDREFLIGEWAVAQREPWVRGWVLGKNKAYLYDLSLTPFPGQHRVAEERAGAVMLAAGMIPLAGPDSPIQSLSAAVWGLNSMGDYAPLWRSQSLSPGHLAEIVASVPDQSPMGALRVWIQASAGLSKVDRVPPVPYSIVVIAGLRDGSVVLSYILPSPPLAPSAKQPLPPGLRPAQITKRDLPSLIQALGRGAPPNPLGRQLLSRTEEYAEVKKALDKAGSSEDPYLVVLQSKPTKSGWVSSGVLPGGMPMEIGRKAEGHAEFRGLWSKTEFVPPKVAEKERRFIPRDIFSFAASICRQVGCVPRGKDRKESLVPEEILTEFDVYRVPRPEDLTDLYAVRAALVQLRNAYEKKLKGGKLPSLTPQLPMGEAPPPIYAELAKLNPLSTDAITTAKEYARTKSEAKRREYGAELSGAFERLGATGSPESWEITPAHVGQLFPREGKRGTWQSGERLGNLSKFDLVSRVGAPDPEIVRQGQERASALEAAQEAGMPFDEPAVRRLMATEAELTLDQALRVLGVQGRALRMAQSRHGGQKTVAMQPSSALNKLHRKRRLTAYSPPSSMFRPQSVLILMSPVGLRQPRIMTFKHGVHIDADRVGQHPGELPGLLGQAIQSALFWLAEKGELKPGAQSQKGRRRFTIYVGRVGYPYLSVALRPGDVLSIQQVTMNLEQAGAGKPSHQAPAYVSSEESAEDVERYLRAVREQIGAGGAEKIEIEQISTRPVQATRASAPSTEEQWEPVPEMVLPSGEEMKWLPEEEELG